MWDYTPFDAGYDDYLDGYDYNPYSYHHEFYQWYWWERGWYTAREDDWDWL